MPDPLEPAPPRQIIRNVAWDETARSHVYRRDVDLTIEGETIAAISPAGQGHGDAVEIDGRGFAVLPGFVDIHAHPSSEPLLKGLTDEVGSRQLYMSSLYEYLPLFEADAEGRRAATEVALCELMQSGVTTVCDLSAAREDWVDTLGASGMRVYAAPMFRSGRWYTPNSHELRYAWDEKAGRDGLDRALRVIDRARQHPSGRLDGVLYPAQVDTCTEELLRDSAAVARERRLPLQIHEQKNEIGRVRRCNTRRDTRYQPTIEKIMRLHAQTAMIENGFVHIPETAPWLDEYLHEITIFPRENTTIRSTPLLSSWTGSKCPCRAGASSRPPAGARKRSSRAGNRNPPKPCGPSVAWNGLPSRTNRAERRLLLHRSSYARCPRMVQCATTEPYPSRGTEGRRDKRHKSGARQRYRWRAATPSVERPVSSRLNTWRRRRAYGS